MKRTKQESFRFGVLLSLMALFFLVVVARLVHLQVFESARYSEIVDRQSSGRVAIPAARGMIYDRYGRVVARDVIGSALYAYPHNEAELRKVADYLDRLYDFTPGTAKKKYGLSERRFRYVSRRLSDEMADRITSSAPRGLYLRQESRREYPFGLVGKQILGFTDIDNKGQAGVEYAFDSILAGQTGWADILRDGLRNTFRVREAALVKPVQGTSMVLTVDWSLQAILEEELERAIDEYNAKSGMAVFVDCNSGDVLAMTHSDPNERDRTRPTKCRVVTDQFEPGSVIKAFAAGGFLEAGIVDCEDSVYCEEGRWKIGRRILHDDKENGWLSFRGVIELSSNIGVAKCAINLGGDELYETYRRFGLGMKPGCELPGETSGVLRKSRWSDYNVAALAMGHSVAVSPLQLVNGFAAIANGGDLMRPRFVVGTVDDKGYVRRSGKPERIGRVAGKAVIDTLKMILRGVVERGTATPVNSPSVMIAGKTGTAEIPDLENKRYFKNRFMASFAGFFPYESPVIAGMIVLEDPKPITYGGWTAGPAFRRIAERYTVDNPDLFTVPERTMIAEVKRLDNTIETPNFVGRDISLARTIAEERGITLHSPAAEGTVDWQWPPPDRLLFVGDEVLVQLRTESDEQPLMADLRGLSLRQASAFLDYHGIQFVIKGNGRVVRQSIRPGKVISKEAKCQLTCRPG